MIAEGQDPFMLLTLHGSLGTYGGSFSEIDVVVGSGPDVEQTVAVTVTVSRADPGLPDCALDLRLVSDGTIHK